MTHCFALPHAAGAMFPATLRTPFSPSFPSSSSKPNTLFLPSPLVSHYNKQHYITLSSTAPHPTSGFSLLQDQLGLTEREAEFLLQKHPDLHLASPELLRRRIATLQHSLKLTASALHRTIARRPDILTSPEIQPFLDYVLQELPELRPPKLERLLASTHPHLLSGFTARIQLLLHHGIPQEKIGHIVDNVNVGKVFCERPLKELEDMILFLKRFSWPDLVLRRPVLLNLDLHGHLIPRIQFLTELGGDDEEAAAAVIAKLPAILAYTVEHYESHLEFWISVVGLTRAQVFKIALVYPNVFSVSRERKLKPRIEFLKQCGFGVDDIFKFLIKAPLFLSLSFEENLAKKLSFLVKIGYRHRTRELALALGAATRTSCENMQMVIGLFFSYGLSHEDVLAMSKKHPPVLQYKHESLEKKMEFLIEEMEREIGELLAFPAFLGYKLDDRIKRRYEVKKAIRGKGMSLNKLLSVSTKRFDLKVSNSSRKKSDCDSESSLTV